MWIHHGVSTFAWNLSSFAIQCVLQNWVISFLLQLLLTYSPALAASLGPSESSVISWGISRDSTWGCCFCEHWPSPFLGYPDLEGIQEDHCVGTLCSCLAIVQLKYILWAVWANFMYLEGEKGNAQWTVSQLHQALSSKKSVFSCLRSFSNTVSNPVRCRESVAKTIFNSERKKKKNSERRLAAGQYFKGSYSASICRNGCRSLCNLHVCLTVAHAMNRCYLLLRAYTLRGRF